MIAPTEGTLTIRFSEVIENFALGEGISITNRRTFTPREVAEVTVTSPAGWLYYQTIGGKHTLWMGPPPSTGDENRPEVFSLMGGGVGG